MGARVGVTVGGRKKKSEKLRGCAHGDLIKTNYKGGFLFTRDNKEVICTCGDCSRSARARAPRVWSDLLAAAQPCVGGIFTNFP